MEQTIAITAKTDRQVTPTKSLPFGKIPTEHLFTAEYHDGQWGNATISPFHDLTISPIALCLHYGQTVFEGMKAFIMDDGKINIFRMDKHYQRFTASLQRMCMPPVSKDLFIRSICKLVATDAAWIPTDTDGSLYIRPFMIATEPRIGVKISDDYLYMVVCSPAYQYYTQPVKVKVETDYIRSAVGGTGYAKCGGNYGGAFYPTQLAKEEGYDQVLWTDSKNHEFIEESGTMNAMFYIDNVLITPPLSSSILDGVTRDSLITLAKDMGLAVEERAISYKELIRAFEAGKKVEAFGAGTAAVIAPMEIIAINGVQHKCYLGEDAVMFRLRDTLYKIRKGTITDKFGWNHVISA